MSLDAVPNTPTSTTTPPPPAAAALPDRPAVVTVQGGGLSADLHRQVAYLGDVKREIFEWAREKYGTDAAAMLKAIRSRNLGVIALGGIAFDHIRTMTAIENKSVTVGKSGPEIEGRFSPYGFYSHSGCRIPKLNQLINGLEANNGHDGQPLGKRFQELDAMLADPNIGTVAILVADRPSKLMENFSLRGEMALKAIRSGKNVLLEKPPFHTLIEANAIMDAAQEKGVTVFTAYHAACTIAIDKLREELTKHRDFGRNPVINISVKYAEYVHDWHLPGSWVTGTEDFPHGMIADSGINAISAVQSLLSGLSGEWPNFNIIGGERVVPAGKFGEFFANIDFEFPQFAHGNHVTAKGNMRLDWANPTEERLIEVTLNDKTRFVLDVRTSSSYIIHPDGKRQDVYAPADNAVIDMHFEQYKTAYCELAERLYLAQHYGLLHTVHTAPVRFVDEAYKNSKVKLKSSEFEIPLPRDGDKTKDQALREEFERRGPDTKSLFY